MKIQPLRLGTGRLDSVPSGPALIAAGLTVPPAASKVMMQAFSWTLPGPASQDMGGMSSRRTGVTVPAVSAAAMNLPPIGDTLTV